MQSFSLVTLMTGLTLLAIHVDGYTGATIRNVGRLSIVVSSKVSKPVVSTWSRMNQYTPSKEQVADEVSPRSSKRSVLHTLKDVWDFTRPHTIIGSSISILSVYLFSIPRAFWGTRLFLEGFLKALLPSLLANVYVTGLNQVTDIEIDRINKPYLPLASGNMSKSMGVSLVTLCGILATFLVWNASSFLKSAVLGSMFLGTIYSLPPFRLKRYPLLAAFCILAVRGALVNLGFFFDAKKSVLNQPLGSLSEMLRMYPESVFANVFFAIFGLVIALMKDVPDISGDTENNIQTFSVRLGSKTMFRYIQSCHFAQCRPHSFADHLVYDCFFRVSTYLLATLLTTFSLGIASLSVRPSLFRSLGMINLNEAFVAAAGLGLAYDVLRRSKKVDPNDSHAVFDYYMSTWNVFYACYLLLPLLRR